MVKTSGKILEDIFGEKNLKKIGFSKVTIETQGNFYAVLANLFKLWGLELINFIGVYNGMGLNKIYIHFYTSTSSYSIYKYLKTSLSKHLCF